MIIEIDGKEFDIKNIKLDTEENKLTLDLFREETNKVSHNDKEYTHDYGLFVPYTETVTKQKAKLEISLANINYQEQTPEIKTYTGEDHY